MEDVKEAIKSFFDKVDEVREQTNRILKENEEKLARWDYLSRKKLELHKEYDTIFKRWYLKLLREKCSIDGPDWISQAFDEVSSWRQKQHEFHMETMKDDAFRVDLTWESYRLGIIMGLIEMRQHLDINGNLKLK